MSFPLAVTWFLSFVLAAIPLHRIVPIVANWIQHQANTLDRPKFKAHHVLAVRSVAVVTVLTIAKGALTGWLMTTYFRPDWTALVLVSLVLVAHGWSIFSDTESPSTFWIWVGLFLVLSPGLVLVFIAVTAFAALLLNVGVLALCVGVAATVYGATSLSLLPSSAPWVLTLVVAVLGSSELLRLGSETGDSPTFLGAFRRRP